MDKIVKNIYREFTCGELNSSNVGQTVKVAGWVNTVRDHGNITFIDLRDHYGIVQIVFAEDKKIKLSKESVVSITGTVLARDDENVNPNIKTGEIEIHVEEVVVLSKCNKTLPFEIMDSKNTNEELRLKYRFLDMRNPDVQKNILFRSKVIQSIRQHMTGHGFNEITTPILTVSSPEGARDYIVPSRVHQGKFYALPQAPQQFKQLLMVSGMEKYFQIAPCFRDEDGRADRSPGEFYQLDMEMSFATQEDVFAVMEDVLVKIFKEYGKFPIYKTPFERIPYKEAMEKYGSDKPDLRNPLLITNVTEVFKDTTFNAFKNSTVKAIAVNCGEQSRKFYDKLTSFATENGAKGLAWIKVDENNNLIGPIVKFMSETEQQELLKATGASSGFSIFIISDNYNMSTKLCGMLRTEIANKLDLIEGGIYKFCWIVDYPMYELDEETNKIIFSHNPFSMPQGELEALNTMNPLDILAYQYDIVLNGVELSSGAVRNYNIDIMLKAFEIAGYSQEDIETKFAALYNAFQYGAPPHAGIAPGIDRMIMLLLEEKNIREVIAFPMNKKAQDLLMNAPNVVSEKQLREVHIKLR